jgi:3-deoxy-D-manno-octulosonic-acid transferase
LRLILVPHETDKSHIDQLKLKLQKKGLSDQTIFYSENSGSFKTESSILIIDTIGLLSRLYRYADLAYIGGGFGVGIHNSLEAAVYGVPLAWGPHYSKFREAVSLTDSKAARMVDDEKSLNHWIDELIHNPDLKLSSGETAKSYVYQHRGATALILEQV